MLKEDYCETAETHISKKLLKVVSQINKLHNKITTMLDPIIQHETDEDSCIEKPSKNLPPLFSTYRDSIDFIENRMNSIDNFLNKNDI